MIGHAGSSQQDSRDEFTAIGKLKTLIPRLDGDSCHFERREKLGTEPPSLRQSTAC